MIRMERTQPDQFLALFGQAEMFGYNIDYIVSLLYPAD
jgi:hypothetical protein